MLSKSDPNPGRHRKQAQAEPDQGAAAVETPKYELKLMFEWGGGCLWCLNDAARKQFDVGPIEERIGLTPEILEKLQKLTEWHDTALNWEYPPDPGPWQKKEYDDFDIAAIAMLQDVRTCLGPQFRVLYDKLGSFEETQK